MDGTNQPKVLTSEFMTYLLNFNTVHTLILSLTTFSVTICMKQNEDSLQIN